MQGIIGLLYKLHILWSWFQTCHNWSHLDTSLQVEMVHVLYIIPHAWWIVQHKSLHVILEEHGESFKLGTPIYERILVQIFVLATAHITITSKLAEIFQILINLSEVIFFAATMNDSSECLNCHFRCQCVEWTKFRSYNELSFICAK